MTAILFIPALRGLMTTPHAVIFWRQCLRGYSMRHIEASSLLRYVPSRLLPFLEDCYRDSDGYWFHFSDHVVDQSTGSHTVHEDTIRQCLQDFRYAEVLHA